MEEIDKVFPARSKATSTPATETRHRAALRRAVRVSREGATACAYSTGMAALHAALFACDLKPGSTVVASQDLYGATTNSVDDIFGAFGVKTVTADFSDLATLREKVKDSKPVVLVTETISNPLLKICDIEACAEIAHSAGARLIVDNTFASPYLCQPLKFGADMVVHSATKYLSGHADAMGGVVVSRDEFDSAALVGVMKLVGGVLERLGCASDPARNEDTCRCMDRQCENARVVAEHLLKNERVGRVYYPGFFEGQELEAAHRMLREPHGGALVSIELKDNTTQGAFRFMNALRLCVRSTSLGDVFTSVLHPTSAFLRDVTPARRRELGVSDGLVRISVGIEKAEDIVADIEQALNRI